MECKDTGCHEAIHLPHLSLAIAQELNEIIGATIAYNKGHGVITIQMKDGEIPVIDWQMRRFRKTNKTA